MATAWLDLKPTWAVSSSCNVYKETWHAEMLSLKLWRAVIPHVSCIGYKRWGSFQMMDASDVTFAATAHPSYHLIPRVFRPEQNPEQSGLPHKPFIAWRPSLKRPNVAWSVHQGSGGLLVRDTKSEGWKKEHVMERSWTTEIVRLGREMLPPPEQVCLWDWCPDCGAALKLRCGAGEQTTVLPLEDFLSLLKVDRSKTKQNNKSPLCRHVTFNISTSKGKGNMNWDFIVKKKKKVTYKREKKKTDQTGHGRV